MAGGERQDAGRRLTAGRAEALHAAVLTLESHLSAFPDLGRRRAAAGQADRRFFIQMTDDKRRADADAPTDFRREAPGVAQQKRKCCGQRPEAYGKAHGSREAAIVQEGGIGDEQELLLRDLTDERLRESLGRLQYPEHEAADGKGCAARPLGQHGERKQHLDDA